MNAVEKLSQLLIQVTGRVGRSGKSKIIVQSNLLDNEYLNILSSGDYLEFSKHLLKAKTLPTLHKNTKNLVEGYIEKQKRLKVRWSVDFNPIDYQ